jgi:hypothetical protein
MVYKNFQLMCRVQPCVVCRWQQKYGLASRRSGGQQQQHIETPNTLTVARTQLRALVEEKENINSYLSEHLAASFGMRFILSCFGLRVTGPGCLSGIPDPDFYVRDLGSKTTVKK